MEFTIMDDLKYLTQDKLNIFCEINLGSLCRVCLDKMETNTKSFNIFADPSTSSMIMSCASVQISESDGLPAAICQECLSKLNIAWQFKILCESSDAKLREVYLSSNITSIDLVHDAGIPGSEEICIIKSSDFKNQYVEKNVMYESPVEKNFKSIPNEKITRETETKNKKPKCKVHQCETCGKIFNRREYLTQHLRIHTGEKPYHCHICEKRFINSGHLITHMRKHTGEKPHQCSLCTKSFSTKQELTKHTMVHKGERPYICTGCGKSFGSSSNLYTHMKHHTGVKTFICEHCSKSFYTKQELKQHQVIHTGEKAFLCEYCNKRFSQIAHLKRHLKLHSKDAPP